MTSGATVSVDIERLRTDQDYFSQQSNAGNVPVELQQQGVVPLGYGGRGPLYLADGPNDLPGGETTYTISGEGGQSTFLPSDISGGSNPDLGTSSSPAAQGSGRRFGTFNADGRTSGARDPGNINTYGVSNPSQTVSRAEVAGANAQAASSNASAAAANPTVNPASNGRSPSDAEWTTFYKEVQGRHNLLHDFNTYNYVITLTALSKEQFENPESYKGKTFNSEGSDFYIIARSGGFERQGAPQVNVKIQGTTYEDTRAQYKPGSGRSKDLFIENLVFDTRVGINDMGNSNLTKGSFEVIEPHGVGGFYEELWAGSRFSGHENYIQAPILLTIHFVGRKAGVDRAIIPDKTTRHLPIMFSGSQMSVDEGGARYTVEFLAYNSVGAGITRSSLWDDIQPYINPTQESVAGILYSTFYKNTEAYRTVLEGIERGLNAEQKAEIEAKISNAEVISQANLGGTNNIGAWIPHEYYVWFAEGYTGSFPKTGAQLSANKQRWINHVQNLIGQEIPPSERDQNLSDSAFQNRFGLAGLNDATTPTSAVNVNTYETALRDATENLNRITRQIDAKKNSIDRYINIINAQRENLAAIQNGTFGTPERDRTADLVPDVTASSRSRSDEILTQTQKVTDEGIQLAIGLAGDGPDPVPPASTNLTPESLAQVVAVRDRLRDAQSEIVKLTGELADLERQKEEAQRAVDDVRARGQEGFNLGSSGVQWNFRKGANLFTVIDTMITNSQVMEQFQDDAKLNAMATSEYIPWYKTEIIPVIIGFDVATMNFVYEFHYVISPYSVHYSKMPGVNIIFSTDRLRQLAVREYNYIYTGKNIDVLNFDIKYNNLFQTPLLLSPPSETALNGQQNRERVVNSSIPKSSYEEAIGNLSNRISNRLGTTGFTPAQAVEKMNYQDLQITNRSHIGLALKEFLYNPPAELALIRGDIEIIGDPVYIIGSGISERPVLNDTDILTPDGEVNGFTREPDIIFNFRFPDDIPSKDELPEKSQQKLKDGAYNGLYQVIGVENRFNEGAFTQRLQVLRRKNQVQDYKVDERFRTEGIDEYQRDLPAT